MTNKNRDIQFKQFGKRLGYIVLAFVFLAIVISAVERKKSVDSVDLVVSFAKHEEGSFITRDDIKRIILRRFGHSLNGVPIGSLDVRAIEEVLEEDPFILDSDVYVDSNNKVNIKVEQREPIIRIIDEDNNSYYLDQLGYKMPLSRHCAARVPVATGHIPAFSQDYRNQETSTIRDLFDLITYVVNDEFLRAQTEQVYVNRKREFVLVPKVGDHKILVGNSEELPEKFRRLKIFYKEGLPYEGWNNYSLINLKFSKQIVCTKK